MLTKEQRERFNAMCDNDGHWDFTPEDENSLSAARDELDRLTTDNAAMAKVLGEFANRKNWMVNNTTEDATWDGKEIRPWELAASVLTPRT